MYCTESFGYGITTNVCLQSSQTIIIMITTTMTMTITITTMTQDYCMLKGITMMMIVLLMKACIESNWDISFVFFLLLFLGDYYRGYISYNNINNIY